MIPERLRASERELRKTIARRHYGDLPKRLAELRRDAEEHLGQLPTRDPLRLEIAGWVLTTIRWARLMTLTQRQMWSGELTRLPCIGRYVDRPDNRRPDVCVDL